MILRPAAAAAIFLLPAVAAAAPPDICQALQRRLATIPQVIGSTAEVRRQAEALRDRNSEIRYLRSEMRRARCGSAGSIVTFGRRDDACGGMADALRDLEAEREAILARRSDSRQMLRPSEERDAVLAALQTHGCAAMPETAPQPVAIAPDDQPAEDRPTEDRQPYSSITTLRPRMEPAAPARQAEIPPPPERAYDPSRKVRTVGPTFLPDDSPIDLANPAN